MGDLIIRADPVALEDYRWRFERRLDDVTTALEAFTQAFGAFATAPSRGFPGADACPVDPSGTVQGAIDDAKAAVRMPFRFATALIWLDGDSTGRFRDITTDEASVAEVKVAASTSNHDYDDVLRRRVTYHGVTFDSYDHGRGGKVDHPVTILVRSKDPDVILRFNRQLRDMGLRPGGGPQSMRVNDLYRESNGRKDGERDRTTRRTRGRASIPAGGSIYARPYPPPGSWSGATGYRGDDGYYYVPVTTHIDVHDGKSLDERHGKGGSERYGRARSAGRIIGSEGRSRFGWRQVDTIDAARPGTRHENGVFGGTGSVIVGPNTGNQFKETDGKIVVYDIDG